MYMSLREKSPIKTKPSKSVNSSMGICVNQW